MDKTTKHIDDLVATHAQKTEELLAIGQKIALSATSIVVGFIDLVESTRMKQDRAPQEWLGYVYKFVQCVDRLASTADGTVVKRIGDELMVTFKDVQAAERFVGSLIGDPFLQAYRYKVAVDFGSAYHFQFLEHLPDDPYGSMVDRCARIAKYAGAGTVFCSKDYRNQLVNPTHYSSMGKFSLHGFAEPEELFAQSLNKVDSEGYVKPMVDAVNKEAKRGDGYRFVGRELTTEFVREFGTGRVRPFLARELLNVPKLLYSPTEFREVTSQASKPSEKEREFIGYFVEWESTFEKFERSDEEIALSSPFLNRRFFDERKILHDDSSTDAGLSLDRLAASAPTHTAQ